MVLDTKDSKTHLNCEDASYRRHSYFRGKTGGKRKGKKQDRG